MHFLNCVHMMILRKHCSIIFNHSDRLPAPTFYAPECSVLIPYEDLRAARATLPEFSGTKAEDPVRFLENTESILGQARIPPAGWTRDSQKMVDLDQNPGPVLT
jgi:hypothetical protein